MRITPKKTKNAENAHKCGKALDNIIGSGGCRNAIKRATSIKCGIEKGHRRQGWGTLIYEAAP